MKIAVYTCSKDERAFVERWGHSTRDADQRLVLDTGSTDGTMEALVHLGIDVAGASIRPWRFDDAKNAALNLLAPDIDVAVQLDMDEVLVEGWREKIESVWKEDTTKLKYKYVWSWTEDGRADRTFFSDKIGGRHTHRWKNPVHEVLMPTVPEVTAICQDVLIEHHPDNSKSRQFYLDLLELSVREDPLNDRNSHYLGREYYFNQKYDEAIKEFQRHMMLPTAKWNAERAASLRYGAKCFELLDNKEMALRWYSMAVIEDSLSKEALTDLATFLLQKGDWFGVLHFTHIALKIPAGSDSYINERYSLQEGPFDLASVAFWNLGLKQAAIDYAKKAIELNPFDERLHSNLKSMGG